MEGEVGVFPSKKKWEGSPISAATDPVARMVFSLVFSFGSIFPSTKRCEGSHISAVTSPVVRMVFSCGGVFSVKQEV